MEGFKEIRKSEPDPEKKSAFRYVENLELGVAFNEKVIELPAHRQEKFGIKQIRRREVVELRPGTIWGSHEDMSNPRRLYGVNVRDGYPIDDPLIEKRLAFLTEGKFGSPSKWNHIFAGEQNQRGYDPFSYNPHAKVGDRTYPESEYFGSVAVNVDKFKSEGLYFQEIKMRLPEEELLEDGFSRDETISQKNPPGVFARALAFSKEDGKITLTPDISLDFFNSSSYRLSPMSVTFGCDVWGSGIRTPLFIFGNENSNLVQYYEAVFNNKEAMAMLKAAGWIDDQAEAEKLLAGDKRNFRRKNIHLLRMFLQGTNFPKNLVGHPLLPIVHHPDIKPFRWCHSEAALVPTAQSTQASRKIGLSVLFFET